MSSPGVIQIIGLENNVNPEVEAVPDALRVTGRPLNIVPLRNGSVHQIGRTVLLSANTAFGGANYAAILMCRSQAGLVRIRKVQAALGIGSTALAAASAVSFNLTRGQDIAYSGASQAQSIPFDLQLAIPRLRTTQGVIPVDLLWQDVTDSVSLMSFQYYSGTLLATGTTVQLDATPLAAVTSSVTNAAGARTPVMQLWDSDAGDQPIELLYGQFVAIRMTGWTNPGTNPPSVSFMWHFQNISVDDFQ